jgi:hypothetical protein
MKMKKLIAIFAVLAVALTMSLPVFAGEMLWTFEDEGAWFLQTGGQEWGIAEGYVEIDPNRLYNGKSTMKIVGEPEEGASSWSFNNDSESKEVAEPGNIFLIRIYLEENCNIGVIAVFDQDAPGWRWNSRTPDTSGEEASINIDESMYGQWIELRKVITLDNGPEFNRLGVQIRPVDASQRVVMWIGEAYTGPESGIPAMPSDGGAAAEPESVPETAAPEVGVPEAAPETPAAVTPEAPKPPAVKTGDAGIIILAGVMMIAAAGVVVFRRKTVK